MFNDWEMLSNEPEDLFMDLMPSPALLFDVEPSCSLMFDELKCETDDLGMLSLEKKESSSW